MSYNISHALARVNALERLTTWSYARRRAPNADAKFVRIDGNLAQNPVVYRFEWTPQFGSEWTNPSFAIFQVRLVSVAKLEE